MKDEDIDKAIQRWIDEMNKTTDTVRLVFIAILFIVYCIGWYYLG